MTEILKVLLIDDDEVDRMVVVRALNKCGFNLELEEADNSIEGLSYIHSSQYDLLILDYRLPGMDGLMLLQKLRDESIKIPTIMLTGMGDERLAVSIMKLGAVDYLSKDNITSEVLKKSIQYVRNVQKSESKLNWLASFPDQHPNPIIEIYEDGTITYLNNAAIQEFPELQQKLLSHSLLKNINELVQPLHNKTEEKITREVQFNQKYYLQTVSVPSPGFIRLYLNDISEQKRLESESLKFQKLESIGLLAGGIAHDFNNILTGIIGSITLAKEYTKGNEKILKILKEAEHAGMQARDLTQRLLTFSKGGVPVKKVSSVSSLLHNSITFLLHGSNIKCNLDIAEDLSFADVDEGQIHQVLNNLTMNAIQAMPNGGNITITAQNSTIKDDTIFPITPGEYVKIEFKDDGPGIPAEILPKIFDPYFSTKDNGSGLGLASCYSIITNHGGFIFAESKLHRGTLFIIYLPCSTEKPILIEEVEADIRIKGGRALLMDDEETILKVSSNMLKIIGFDVVTSMNGDEVVQKYKEAIAQNMPFDIVIMDLTIPGGKGGKEALDELLHIDPNVKAIVSSGYSNDDVMSQYKRHGFKGVISKPYKMETLKKVIAEILVIT